MNRADSFADVDGYVESVRRCSSASSTSTTTSSCGEGYDEDSLQLEPPGFTLYAGWRRPSQGVPQGVLQPPPGFGPAGPMAGPGRTVRRMSEAVAVAVAANTRKASIGIVELGGMASRKASIAFHDVVDFAAAAAALSRKASAHVIEALELQELPGLRYLQHQAQGLGGLGQGMAFQRISFAGSSLRRS